MIEVSIAINISENTQPGSMVSIGNTETVVPLVGSNDWEGLFLQIENQLERLATDVQSRAMEQIQEHRNLARRGAHYFQRED
jgi:hypothetical protein